MYKRVYSVEKSNDSEISNYLFSFENVNVFI